MVAARVFRSKYPSIVDLVIPVIECAVPKDHSFSWVALAEVGKSAYGGEFTVRDIFGQIPKFIDRLAALHSLGVVHGDARLPNILYCTPGVWKWIDMRRTSGSLSTQNFVDDWESLVKSILHRFSVDCTTLPDSFQQHINHICVFKESSKTVEINADELQALTLALSTTCNRSKRR